MIGIHYFVFCAIYELLVLVFADTSIRWRIFENPFPEKNTR
jgi:hypothetical protein